MHHETTKALYELFPLEDKNDFFAIYLYLKYLDHFFYHVFQSLGLPAVERPGKTELDEGLEDMIEAYAQQIGEAALSADTNIYHGKVVKLQDAIKLVTQREDLNLPLSKRVIPFKLARDVILKNPDSIAVGTCVCRALSPNPCLPPPQEVCLFVGDPFASFLDDQNPKFRRISQAEAVKVIEDAHRRGDVHCAYFKKEAVTDLLPSVTAAIAAVWESECGTS